MEPTDTIAVSELARRTRAVMKRLAEDPEARLLVMKNNRPVAVISGVERAPARAKGPGAAESGVLGEVMAKRALIATLAAAHGARSVHLFGSAARGKAVRDSDLDFLVALEPGRSLLDLIGLENDLADVFGRKVDVVTAEAAKPRVRASALREGVRIV